MVHTISEQKKRHRTNHAGRGQEAVNHSQRICRETGTRAGDPDPNHHPSRRTTTRTRFYFHDRGHTGDLLREAQDPFSVLPAARSVRNKTKAMLL